MSIKNNRTELIWFVRNATLSTKDSIKEIKNAIEFFNIAYNTKFDVDKESKYIHSLKK